ncbi:MAG: DUF3820 family protein [Saprospiraceae bacterium]|nr:DUF3820 family protein [Saprospiraceae bacterium]
MQDKPDPTILMDIQSMIMPYGKYKGILIKNIPTYYLEWMSVQGFPSGRFGMLLSTTYVIKSNGLEYLLSGKQI